MVFTSVCRSRIIIEAYKEWILPDSRVLDVGCGNMLVTDELKKYFNCFLMGTDIIDYHEKNIPFKIMLQEDKLPFNDREFDIAMFNDSLPYCKKWEAIIDDALRVANEVIIFLAEPTIMLKLWDRFCSRIFYEDKISALNLKTAGERRFYFQGRQYQFRRARAPLWYPFRHFAFKVK